MAVVAESPPPDIRTIQCSGCGWTLEYRPSDKVPDPDDDIGHNAPRTYIRCPRPECRRYTNTLSPTDKWGDYDL